MHCQHVLDKRMLRLQLKFFVTFANTLAVIIVTSAILGCCKDFKFLSSYRYDFSKLF